MGRHVDLWMHAGDAHDTGSAATLVVLDEDGRLVPGKADHSDPSPHASRAAVERHLNEFWRVLVMLPVVVGRAERVKGVPGGLAFFGNANFFAGGGGTVVVASDGTILGGIGVSGRTNEEDEAIAQAGKALMATSVG